MQNDRKDYGTASRRSAGEKAQRRAPKLASERGSAGSAEMHSGMPALHVAMAASEITPFAKTGGLADVVGSLAPSLERLGLRISLIMPCYRSVLHGPFQLEDTGVRFTVPISERREAGVVLRANIGNATTVYFIRADRYFDREGLYGTPDSDYPDNAERFVFFSRAILEVLKLDPPDILHAHDWQTALSIAFLKAEHGLHPQLSSVKTVLTVHNAAYQGVFWHQDWHLLNLESRFFTPDYLEFYGKINFLKGGLVFADRITTVSPTHAEEIKTTEQGFGLDGVFRERADRLEGILNGVDYDVWNPETDPFISRTYGPDSLPGKRACKADLQQIFCLPDSPDVPLVGMVSRLAGQKGFDLLQKAMDDLLCRRLQFVILGSGERRHQDFLISAAMTYPEKVGVRIAFDDSLAHRIIAGSDILLVPSHYEPCGLAQIYALRYGAVPLVRATGGLRDTVHQFDPKTGVGNGFLFGAYRASSLLKSADQALALFDRKQEWKTLMRNAMAADFSWDRSTPAYLGLYRKLAGG